MVETDVSREYVLASRLEELRKQKSFEKPKVIKPAGQPGMFSGTRAWELGFVKSLAGESRRSGEGARLAARSGRGRSLARRRLAAGADRIKGPDHGQGHRASSGLDSEPDPRPGRQFLLPVDR